MKGRVAPAIWRTQGESTRMPEWTKGRNRVAGKDRRRPVRLKELAAYRIADRGGCPVVGARYVQNRCGVAIFSSNESGSIEEQQWLEFPTVFVTVLNRFSATLSRERSF